MTQKTNVTTESYAPILQDGDFDILADRIRKKTGLLFSQSKRHMIEARLLRATKPANISELSAYIHEVIDNNCDDSLEHLIPILTTNVTSFFRERYQLEYFDRSILPELIHRAKRGHRVRIWSAGCSSGEEAYSIAMLIHHRCPEAAHLNIKILATDIDNSVLKRARTGVYPVVNCQDIPASLRAKFVETIDDQTRQQHVISEKIRTTVHFRHLNLIDEWPMKSSFDAIFCRNVLIYFDSEAQRDIWPKFHKALSDGGWIFIGHSERVHPDFSEMFATRFVPTFQKNSDTRSSIPRGLKVESNGPN